MAPRPLLHNRSTAGSQGPRVNTIGKSKASLSSVPTDALTAPPPMGVGPRPDGGQGQGRHGVWRWAGKEGGACQGQGGHGVWKGAGTEGGGGWWLCRCRAAWPRCARGNRGDQGHCCGPCTPFFLGASLSRPTSSSAPLAAPRRHFWSARRSASRARAASSLSLASSQHMYVCGRRPVPVGAVFPLGGRRRPSRFYWREATPCGALPLADKVRHATSPDNDGLFCGCPAEGRVHLCRGVGRCRCTVLRLHALPAW